ncbi:MAG TPA: amidohydrolase, partial [Vicinamibacteria bacterium]
MRGTFLFLLAFAGIARAQEQDITSIQSVPKAPPRAEGDGPFSRLILRGATLIDGTGAPPVGPVDVVVEGNVIRSVQSVGYPGVPIDSASRPAAGSADKELDLEGMYLLPGFIDMHGHVGGAPQGTPAEYVFKLWMGHGITTVRDPGSMNGVEWMKEHRAKSEKNEITAPRLAAYVAFGQGTEAAIATPEDARAWGREIAAAGADGIKFLGERPDVMEAALDEAKKQNLRTACHHSQLNVAWNNVLDNAR